MKELVDNSETKKLKSETTCAELANEPPCDKIDVPKWLSCSWFRLPYRQVVRHFQDYLDVKKIPSSSCEYNQECPHFHQWVWKWIFTNESDHHTYKSFITPLYSQQSDVYQVDWTSIAAI